jgi:PAS domain S-box-containing protein
MAWQWVPYTVLASWLASLASPGAAAWASWPDLPLEVTPFLLLFAGLSVNWGLFRSRLPDLVPMARQTVVESIGDGVVVLDERNRVVDLNPAASQILSVTAAEAVGHLATQVLPALPDLSRESPDTIEVSLGKGKAERHFSLRVSPLRDQRDHLLGRVLLLHDLTDRRRAEEVLLRRNRELALFNHAGQAFTSTLDLDQVFLAVLDEVRRLLNVAICSIWLFDPSTEELVCQQASGPKSEMVRGWRLSPGQGLTGWVFQNQRCLLVEDTRSDERHFKGVDERTGYELRSILSVPLRIKNKVIGTLDAADTEVGHFVPSDLALVESLAATAAIAIENARLYDQARRDAQTRAVLLDEVNHRVKNNLTAIIGLLYAEKDHPRMGGQDRYQDMMQDLIGHIQGLATVHQLLSASEWAPLRLSELIGQVIESSLNALPLREKNVAVAVSRSEVRVTPEQANCLAIVTNEVVTNTAKYALQGREMAHIQVQITTEGEAVLIEFRDDGPGYPDEVLRWERYNVGLHLVREMVRSELHGSLSLRNDGGAVMAVRFDVTAEGSELSVF